MKEWIRIKEGWQTPVPDALLNADISKGAKLLWICLKSFASKTSPQPFPGRYTLCKMIGGKKAINKESFYAYRQELIDGHYLEPEEQVHRERGQWGSRCYTLGLPDSDSKSKRISSPCLENPDTDKPDTEKPYPVNPDTKSTSIQKSTKSERNTITKGTAEAASGDVDLGSCFLKRWCQAHREWFGKPYVQKHGEGTQVRKLMEELECRPKDLLAYAFRMWLNTAQYDDVDTEAFDPLFYQIKGSRNLRFFLKHISEIATEQKEPLDCSLKADESEYQELERQISKGRP